MIQVTSGLLNRAIMAYLIDSVAQIVMNGSTSKMITVLVCCFFSGGPMPGHHIPLKGSKGPLQAKSNARDRIVFHLLAYLEHNCIRFKMRNSTVPCTCNNIVLDINPV